MTESLLRTKEYIDLVEIDKVAHEKYGWPNSSGIGDSFHYAIQRGEYNNDSTAYFEFTTEEYEDELDDTQRAVEKTLRQMIKDGLLPDREEFEFYVWW